MRRKNCLLIVITLFCIVILFHTTAHAAEPSDPAKAGVITAIYQVKTVLIRQLTPGDIEEMISNARDMGATGYKINHYSGGKMGWSIEDSKGREVYSVIFSFLGRQAKEGTYFGPLMSFQDAEILHRWHDEVLSDHFKQIGSDKYNLYDNCEAIIKLFKGSTGLGRTIITVECH